MQVTAEGALPGNTDQASLEAWRRYCSEDDALSMVRGHAGTLIVDLDETLYLHNSTETFLALARPALLAAYVLRLLDALRPWRWTGGRECRDNWRVAAVLLLFPWTAGHWRRFCRRHVAGQVNEPLRSLLANHPGRVIIASNGYRRLIEPMVPHLGLTGVEMICCGLRRIGDRRDGKAALVRAVLGDDEIAASMVVTDSTKDADILNLCGSPCLIKWNRAVYRRAFYRLAYLPGDYLSQVKRPRQRALRKLAREDLLPWLFIGMSAVPFSLWNVAAAALLFCSLWAVYEIGYFDNDRCALLYESDPKLTAEFASFDSKGFELRAWVVAAAFGCAGVLALNGASTPLPFLRWASMLAFLRLTYWLYNRIDKQTRVWLYFPLQLFRNGAFAVMAPLGAIGYAIIIAQTVSRWLDYIIYRYLRTFNITEWPKTANRTIRLLLCLLMLLPFILMKQWHHILSPAIAIVAWFAYISLLYEVRPIIAHARRIDGAAR